LVILAVGLEPSAGTYGPRFIKNKNNSLIASVDAVFLYNFPERGTWG